MPTGKGELSCAVHGLSLLYFDGTNSLTFQRCELLGSRLNAGFLAL